MKEGYYTNINGYEYRLEQRKGADSTFETVIITGDKAAADDTFSFDKERNSYIKVIDTKSVGAVLRYSISYYYQGHMVGRLGERDNYITIFLDYKDKDLAVELGFTEHDRTEFIKTVDVSEIEMKQNGPYNACSWY